MQRWIADAAAHLKNIISYYEKLQNTSDFFEKIQIMREQLAKTESPEQALEIAINVYKPKLESLFRCDAFDIPQ